MKTNCYITFITKLINYFRIQTPSWAGFIRPSFISLSQFTISNREGVDFLSTAQQNRQANRKMLYKFRLS